ncbi:uncharacterized protein (TIGR03083 family) [Arthrobacter sp. CAN_A212]|uniref:maleylpyruvate isomerase family mycothiol-dependent enzyme n=1 Tax=unclassified Arthrobacter TaxID=235627 RepID=UPI0018C9E8A7|nr:maleylpyruvate isomerase family mycothiol-dependent enzyme [Arthrobacter sp. CAN_C5]MBP2218301.1 uncharacterized protein (TIGR03083 family) [Arthrobacter sp. CAN_C5]
MRKSTTKIWQTVHAARRELVEDLSSVSGDEWLTPSLCPGWDIHDVLAHLVDTARTGRASFARGLLAARLDFDRLNEIGIARAKHSDPRDTLAALGRDAYLTRTPPANLATRLVEAFVHGEDIRRPLGIPARYPHDAVATALDYQLKTRVSYGGGRERAHNLRLVDRDTGASWGQGDTVEADGIDLLLAVSGRTVEAARLTGGGAPRLSGHAAAG